LEDSGVRIEDFCWNKIVRMGSGVCEVFCEVDFNDLGYPQQCTGPEDCVRKLSPLSFPSPPPSLVVLSFVFSELALSSTWDELLIIPLTGHP